MLFPTIQNSRSSGYVRQQRMLMRGVGEFNLHASAFWLVVFTKEMAFRGMIAKAFTGCSERQKQEMHLHNLKLRRLTLMEKG